MATAIINNQTLELKDGEQLNCIQAAQRIGYEIPSYCWHPALSVVASCRMCLVEVGDTKPDGTVVMQPKLVPGCQTPVKEGTVVIADSEKVKAAQKATLEYLLLNHPLDCPTCDQAGECFLQDYSYKYGRGYSRLQEPKNIKPDKDHIGENITLFTDRCIMCTRCVRFTREVSGTSELQVVSRGSAETIDTFPGIPCDNKLAGNVVDLCPVGALCSKDFLYQQRVWWLKTTKSVCAGCSTGCSVDVDQNEDQVYRLTPRSNPLAQGDFMCDEGRFGWKYIHSDERLTFPARRKNGEIRTRDWDDVIPSLQKALAKAVGRAPEKCAAVFSPWMTVEEAYMLASYLRGLSPKVKLALGPVKTVGEDDTYPKDFFGKPKEPVKFTIRAEKAPNRRGVQMVLNHFGGAATTLSDLAADGAAGKLEAIYLVGGDPTGWLESQQATGLGKASLVIVQDILPSTISERADFLLTGGSFAERDGSFVNYKGLAQQIGRSVRGPDGTRPDGRILWDLTGRKGLFNAAAVRKEMAEKIPAFAAFAQGTLGDCGVLLNEHGAPEAHVVAKA
ncbi:molybdopterin-dependent oxidoreductase [Lacipirellula parvula]|uniref:NADH-ubiquinone oxidoreductase chain G n=1 Tax=Lacipirellula parvula TaxID=2650471 RepID=A0A5K7X5C3_9BACT|nr:molybdopterin-dependent oxidoreductase [Lacipirellula parvula]BBO31904.1 NADH-ubiquinone oxidoreductase chain G [Lacipirellula parvula]